MKAEVIGQIISSFKGGGQRVEKMPEGDPLRIKGESLGAYFTEGVALLRGFPNAAIRDLAGRVWDIVGSRIVPTALGPEVPTLSLVVMASKESAPMHQACIFVPHHWDDMIEKDPVYQLGALVFVGSQAVDYYNGRVVGESENALKRARASEAEYVLTVKADVPTFKPNEWQQHLLREFPEGLRSAAIRPLLYAYKAFVPPA